MVAKNPLLEQSKNIAVETKDDLPVSQESDSHECFSIHTQDTDNPTFYEVRLLLAMALAKPHWTIERWDVEAAYLNAPIDESLVIIDDQVNPSKAWLLRKAKSNPEDIEERCRGSCEK